MADKQLFVVLFELKDESRTLEDFTGAIINAVDGWPEVSVVAVKLLPKEGLSVSGRMKSR